MSDSVIFNSTFWQQVRLFLNTNAVNEGASFLDSTVQTKINLTLKKIGVTTRDLSLRKQVVNEILNQSSNFSVIDQAILLAIAEQESAFNPSATNKSSSAKGVFQIIKNTWDGLGMQQRSPLNFKDNIVAGIRLYEQNLQILNSRSLSLSSPEKAVAMYVLHHDGPSGIDYGGEKIARRLLLPRFFRWKELLQ